VNPQQIGFHAEAIEGLLMGQKSGVQCQFAQFGRRKWAIDPAKGKTTILNIKLSNY
jgi:hypothetical protein